MEIGESGIREYIACAAVRRSEDAGVPFARRGDEDGALHFGAEGNRIDLGAAAVRDRREIGYLRPARAAILALEKTLPGKFRDEMVRGEGIAMANEPSLRNRIHVMPLSTLLKMCSFAAR